MQVNNLLLLGLLVSSFGQRQLWAAGVGETKEAVAADNGPGAGVPAVGGAGAAPASALTSTVLEEGPLAKLELLRGQMTGAPEAYQGATLVHGAMLWELGIVKSLYTLLIAPEKDTTGRLVAGAPICPLGAVLKQLFYFAGGTLAPTKVKSSLAHRITSKLLGELYAACMNENVDRWSAIGKGKIRSTGTKDFPQLMVGQEALKVALTGCYQTETSDVLNPVNLCPSIIMAYFWAKYVMPCEKLADAQISLSAFNGAAFPGAPLPSAASAGESVQALDAVEAEAIERIKTFYKYDIPKPPVQGMVVLPDGRRFPDCGESGLRGLFQTIFFNKETQQFVIPEGAPEGFYDNALVQYFRKFSTKDDQNTQVARNAWGTVMSDRHDIVYNPNRANSCDMGCDFKNLMSMLAQLVPGVYKNLCINCGCSLVVTATEAASGAGAAVEAIVGDSLPAQIAAHFERSPDCAKKMLEALAVQHNLFLSEYNSADNKSAASWKLSRTKPEEAQCFLVYQTDKGHMDCDLQGALRVTFGQFTDPILGCSDALTNLPQDPDMLAPLVFAAARMEQKNDFVSGYLGLLPSLDHNLLEKIKNAIDGWGLLTTDYAHYITPTLNQYGQHLAALRGLTNTCKFFLEPILETIQKNSSGDDAKKAIDSLLRVLFNRAAENGFLSVIKYLCATAADRLGEKGMSSFTDALELALKNGHLPIIKYFFENYGGGIEDFKMYTDLSFIEAAKRGHLSVVQYLYEVQKIENINTGFVAAAIGLQRDVVQYLMDSSSMSKKSPQERSDLLGNALVRVVSSGEDLRMVQYLCQNGANLSTKLDGWGFSREIMGKKALEIAKQRQPRNQEIIDCLDFWVKDSFKKKKRFNACDRCVIS